MYYVYLNLCVHMFKYVNICTDYDISAEIHEISHFVHLSFFIIIFLEFFSFLESLYKNFVKISSF